MSIEIYNGLKFGQMTVVGLNKEEPEDNNGKAILYNVECDCGKEVTLSRTNILKRINRGVNTSCGLCYTFEDWCIDNNHQDYLDLWDYELNDKKPSEISCGSGKKFYFRCRRGLHESELTIINSYTKNNKFNHLILCNKCNSFGQYLLDEYGGDAIEKYWSDKNSVDPFEIAKHKITKVYIKCQFCGNEKDIYCTNFIKQGLGCVCSSKNSYPNKFIHNLLIQLDIKSKPEKSFKWSRSKKYDEYIKSLSCIIENHGLQHYNNKHNWSAHGGRDLYQEQENDKLKEHLAKNNGIKHYIVLDCRKSELEWIKNSVMNSELPKLLNFKEEDIDWLECEKFASQSTLFYICEIWNNNMVESMKDIITITGLDRTTLIDYLSIGNKLGICRYNGKEEMKKSQLRTSKLKQIPIEVYKDDAFLFSFESISDLDRNSERILGVKLNGDIASLSCRGKRNPIYKGFTFKFR